MGRMVTNAEGALDQAGNALGGPDIAQEAVGFGPLLQQAHQLGLLLGSQPGGGAGGHPMGQGLDASFARPFEPLAHRAWRHAQGCGYGAAAPALLVQRPGAEPPPLVQLRPGRGYADAHAS